MGEKRDLKAGVGFLLAFLLWTILISRIDVQAAGPNGSEVGFAAFNMWFHHLTGVHLALYTLTDWVELLAIGVCAAFGVLGAVQAVQRRSLLRVDRDIILLGVYYLLVILFFLFFELFPVNYRPVLIEGVLEASYPSSTTLLVLSVMPTLRLQSDRRVKSPRLRKAVGWFVLLFSLFMVAGRLVSGVHWATDIIGAVLLSRGLFLLYRHCVRLGDQNRDVVQDAED